MQYKINYSPEFLNDLFQIGDYIEIQLHNPAAADRITSGIIDSTDILAEYPETGAKIFLPGGLDSEYRFVTFEDYLAIYQIRFNEVYIARAVNVRQDYMRVLFPWLQIRSDHDE